MSSTEAIIQSTSADTVLFFVTAPNNSVVGPGSAPPCSCHSMAIPSIPALWPPAISASSQEEWFDSQSTSPGAWNTSQRSTITLNFNKVLLLQMKTIPFQYCLSSCTGRLVYIPACSTLCQEIVPAKLLHKHLSQRICLLIGFIRTPQRHTLGTELGQHRHGSEQSRQRGRHSHPSSSSYYLFKSNSIMLGKVPAEPQTSTKTSGALKQGPGIICVPKPRRWLKFCLIPCLSASKMWYRNKWFFFCGFSHASSMCTKSSAGLQVRLPPPEVLEVKGELHRHGSGLVGENLAQSRSCPITILLLVIKFLREESSELPSAPPLDNYCLKKVLTNLSCNHPLLFI